MYIFRRLVGRGRGVGTGLSSVFEEVALSKDKATSSKTLLRPVPTPLPCLARSNRQHLYLPRVQRLRADDTLCGSACL